MTFTFVSIAALKVTGNYSTPPVQGDIAIVAGYSTSGDGGGGEFYWENSFNNNNVFTDGGIIIKVGSVGTGRWVRVFSGALNVKWYGAKADDNGSSGTDNKDAFNNAILAAASLTSPTGVVYNEIFVPAGKYYIGGTINITDKPNLKIYGEGKASVLRCNGITIFSISSSTYFPDYSINGKGPQNLVTGNEIKDITLKGKSQPQGSPSVNSIGINLLGVTNGVIERVYYSGLDKVINQDQAESYVFRNITPVSLENIYTDPPQNTILSYSDDCNYIIYSNCGTDGNYRSDDNIYTEIVGRALKSEIYLDRSDPLGIPGKGFHDGASISECILFACADNNIFIKLATETTITSNKLFAAGKEAINLFSPVYCSITGNLISTPGNNATTQYSGITIFSTAGTPLFGSVTITGNIIERPTGNGIDVTVCDGITIADNIIISPGETQRFAANKDKSFTKSGISIKNSKNFNITRNVCTTYYDNVPPPGTAKYYPIDWKADIELDSLCYGSVLHDTTYQSRGVLNNSSNVLSYSGYDDYEAVEFISAGQLSTQVNGYRIGTAWSVANATIQDEDVEPINPKFLNIIGGNKSIKASFGNSASVVTYIETGTGISLEAGQYATFSVWAKASATNLETNPAVVILQIFGDYQNDNNPSIKQIYIDSTAWKRYYVTIKQESAHIPKIRVVSTGQPAMTIYFSPIQVTYTKNLLPTFYRTCHGSSIPPAGTTYWYIGDTIINDTPTISGNPPNFYIIEKWLCTASGYPGTWREVRYNV